MEDVKKKKSLIYRLICPFYRRAFWDEMVRVCEMGKNPSGIMIVPEDDNDDS